MNLEEQKRILKDVFCMELISSRRIQSGVSHKNYKIETNKGKYVLKILNKHNQDEELKEEIKYLLYLKDYDIPLLIPEKSGDDYFIDIGSYMVILYKYIDHATDQITKENIYNVGKVVGRLNKVPISKDLKPRPNRRFIWKELVEMSKDKELVQKFLTDFKPYYDKFSKMELPICIIHSDIWTGNILFDKDNKILTILDWESVDIYHRLFEISVVIIGCCYFEEKIDFDSINIFLDSYLKEVELTDIEIENLYDYLCYTILWAVSWRYAMFNIKKLEEKYHDYYIPMYKTYDDLKKLGREEFYRRVNLRL